MPNESCSEVLRNPCALTLGDEPLASGVEHGAMQLRVEAAQVGIPLHHLIDSEIRKQPASFGRAVSNSCSRIPCSGTSRSAALDFSKRTALGLMLTNRPRFPFAVMSSAMSPQISPERMPVSSPKRVHCAAPCP